MRRRRQGTTCGDAGAMLMVSADFGGSTMSDTIRMSRDGAVAAITIDRAAEGNVLTTEMLRALTAAIRAAAASDAKVIALRSTGPDFCRGRDGKGGPQNPTALVMRDQVLQPILDVYDALNGAPQPVVCAVQGAALGLAVRWQPPAM